MKGNDSNFIHFIFNDDYNNIDNLEVTPKPKSIIRLFMFWKKIESNISLDISAPGDEYGSGRGLLLGMGGWGEGVLGMGPFSTSPDLAWLELGSNMLDMCGIDFFKDSPSQLIGFVSHTVDSAL